MHSLKVPRFICIFMHIKNLTSLGICGFLLIANTLAEVQPKRKWGPEQATGAPDTMEAAGLASAWGSLKPDAGPEWLEVSFAKAVGIDEVRIRETFNPGAVCKIVAISNDKKEIVLWEGDGNPIAAPVDMVMRPVLGIKSDQIKIHLDTKRIRGWNEIDAVELIGVDGSRQWGRSATASSFYGENENTPRATPTQSNLSQMVEVQGGVLPQGSNLEGQAVDSFQIGKYEVTWGLWKEVRDWAVENGKGYDFVEFGNTYPEGSGDNFPVAWVSWYDAIKWCNARSEREGLNPVYQVNWDIYKTGQIVPVVNNAANGYRLPEEKEWEWAAQGGVTSKGYTYSGSNDADAVAWTQENSKKESKIVGTKEPNELGIHDMSGNIFEWCWDKFNGNRSLRGGGWYFPVEKNTVARRSSLPPDRRHRPFGFRVARNDGK